MKKQIAIFLICLSFSCFKGHTQDQSLLDSLVDIHNDFGFNGIYSQTYDSSKAFFENEIVVGEKYGFWELVIGAVNYLASIADRYQLYEDMGKALDKGNAVLRSHQEYLDSSDTDYSMRSGFLIQLAMYNARMNRVKDSEQIMISLIRHLNNHPGSDTASLFTSYAYLADLYLDLGLYEKVYPYYLLMGKSIPAGDYHDYYEFDRLQYMSSYFLRVREFNSAKQLLTTALHKKYVRQVNAEWNERVTTFYELLSKTYQGLNSYDSAVLYLKKSLSLQEAHSPTLVLTYEYFGDCYAHFKKYREALVYYQKVDSLYRKSSSYSSFKRAQILGKIGESKLNLKDYKGALRTVQSAFYGIYNESSYLQNMAKNPVLSSVHADIVLIKLFIVKSGALAELTTLNQSNPNYLKSAIETFLYASKLCDKFRHEISTDDFKQLFVTDIRPMYEKAVNTCWLAWKKNNDDSLINRAYYFMEKSKYQVLLDAINTGHAEDDSRKLPNDLARRTDEFKIKLISQQNNITMLELKSNHVQLEKTKLEYAQTRNRYEDFLDTLERNYPDYYNLKLNDNVLPVRYLQRKIDKKVFIEYMVADDYIAMIGINKDKCYFNLVPADAAFFSRLNELLGILRTNPYLSNVPEDVQFRNFVSNSTTLYDMLFREIQARFKGSGNFIIVTDGVLSYLPFEILLEKYTGNEYNYANLKYVMKNSVIGYEYSGTILLQKTKKATFRFADNYVGFAPESGMTGPRTTSIPGIPGPITLSPLHFSGNETSAAEEVLNGKLFSGTDAKARMFRKNALNARIIHFAGHTIVNDSLPGLSCLLFSGGANQGVSDSAVIFSNEILNLDLNADLVLLSTCESGTGKLYKGEGLLSIGRSFRYAGARSMVMTMWKINDQSASDIIVKFCRYLHRGRTSDVALRKAKLDYIKNADPKFNHPYYWAAFVFIGNEGPVMKRWNTWLFLPVLIIAAGILYLRKRKKVKL
jgi:CHAT domain-containing protein